MRYDGRTVLPWKRLIDFAFLSGALYFVLSWARRARAMRLALLALAAYLLSLAARRLDLMITSLVLLGAGLMLGLSIIFVFQAELRGALSGLALRFMANPAPLVGGSQQLAETVFDLAAQRIGALVVLPRRDRLEDITSDGTAFGARVSQAALFAIFQKHSPLHDGAAIVDGERITRVNVVLPLSRRRDIPLQFGTRHRAAMGLTEQSDAVAIVASEETGEVRLASRGELKLLSTPGELEDALLQRVTRARPPLSRRVLQWFVQDWRSKGAALVVAGLIWGLAFYSPATALRRVSVPVEFVGVPTGLRVGDATATHIECEVRGSTWLVDSLSSASLVARLDLTGSGEGTKTIALSGRVLRLPPGVTVEGMSPASVRIRLDRER